MRSAAPQSATQERPPTVWSDAHLTAAAQHDRRAFEPLYQRYFDAVFRFCFYRLGDWQDAEDATSDIFANVLANLPRFRSDGEEDSFRCWLFMIARHAVSNRRRDHARHPRQSLETATSLLDDDPTPEEHAVAADEHRMLVTLLAQLKPDQRDLLELRLIGLNDAQIARILGRSHAAVRKEQSRTIKTLRTLVGTSPEFGAPHA